jgi:hypothetical protein
MFKKSREILCNNTSDIPNSEALTGCHVGFSMTAGFLLCADDGALNDTSS